MLMQILQNTPIWVWLLLAALLALGLQARRSRLVSTAALLGLPLGLLGVGVAGMASGFARQPLTLLLWLAALVASAMWSRNGAPPAGARWLGAEQRFHLPGSWAPMATILALFSLKYGMGVAMALRPDWRSSAAVLLPQALAYGLISGLLLGRRLALLRLRPHGPEGVAAVA